MKSAPFDYLRVDSVEEAAQVLAAEGGDARIIAGGQSLMPMLAMRLATPALLVDIMHVEALRRIDDDGKVLRIGAGVRQRGLEHHAGLAERHPLLAKALPWVGHSQTRARGTVCGSIAHADPSAELALVLMACGGTVHLRAGRKKRSVAAADFFTGMMATAKAENEMIEAVSYPVGAPGHGYAYREIARRHGDYAIVGCAATARPDGTTSLAVAGVADQPMVRDLPAPDDSGFFDALNQFAWDLNARDDLHATGRYRRDMVRRLGRQTIEEAVRCRD